MTLQPTGVSDEVSIFVNETSSSDAAASFLLQEMARNGFDIVQNEVPSVGNVNKSFTLKIAQKVPAVI